MSRGWRKTGPQLRRARAQVIGGTSAIGILLLLAAAGAQDSGIYRYSPGTMAFIGGIIIVFGFIFAAMLRPEEASE